MYPMYVYINVSCLNVLLEIVLINLKITHLPTYFQKNAEQLITVSNVAFNT